MQDLIKPHNIHRLLARISENEPKIHQPLYKIRFFIIKKLKISHFLIFFQYFLILAIYLLSQLFVLFIFL